MECSLDRRLARHSRRHFRFRIGRIIGFGCVIVIGYLHTFERVSSEWPFAQRSPSLRRKGHLIVVVLPLLLGLVKGQKVCTDSHSFDWRLGLVEELLGLELALMGLAAHRTWVDLVTA